MEESNKNSITGKRVLIFQQRNWARTIGHFLAKKLSNENCKLAAITLKRSTDNFVRTQKEVKYESIISDDFLMSEPEKYLAGETCSLEEICHELDINTIWPLVGTIRNFVKSYGDKYYYGFKQNVSDEHIVFYVKAVYKCMKKIFEEFGPDVILAPNFVVLPHIMFNLYARKRGVPMLAVTDSKIKSMFIFTYDYLDSSGPFFDALNDLNANRYSSKNRAKAKRYIEEFKKDFKKPDHEVIRKQRSLKQMIRHEIAPYYHIFKFFISKPENFVKSIGPTIDYRSPRIILRDHYARKRYQKFMDNCNYESFDNIKKFIYFPLQFQPEAAIDVVSPFVSNQIETARQVAMSLPGDYVLVVKEHPAMVGLRPPSYIEKIRRTPNIKLVDYKIPTSKILKRASLIINPGGTVMAEAVFYKKPAIQLGDLGITLKLPNVTKHSDMSSLSKKIKAVLDSPFDEKEYDRQLENYIAAVFDTGFDFKYTKFWYKGAGEDAEVLWKIYKKEISRAIQKI